MKVVYKPGNAYEEIDCFDFREYEHGVVLRNEDGYNIGYVPHEILSPIPVRKSTSRTASRRSPTTTNSDLTALETDRFCSDEPIGRYRTPRE